MTMTEPGSQPASSTPGAIRRVGLLAATWQARAIFAASAGALLHVSFPPRTLWWLAPFAFALLGLVLHRVGARAGFGYGLLFGLAFNLTHLVWIQNFLGADFGPWPWLGLSLIMAAFTGLACACMTLVSGMRGGPVWMAALFVTQEWARSLWPLNGFPWGRVAFGQPDGAFASLASLGGAPLVSFAVVLTGFCLGRVLLHAGRPHRNRIVFPALGTVLPLIASLIAWPAVNTAQTSGSAHVGIVQGNAPDAGLDLMGSRDTIRNNHVAESEQLLDRIRDGTEQQPDLVVWPETATGLVGEDPVLDDLVSRFAAPTLIGAMYRTTGDQMENAVVQWSPETGEAGRYTKQELVPFSEHVPMRSIARVFTPFVERTTDLRAGDTPGMLGGGGVNAGVAICYEVAYDPIAREAVRDGADLLVVPTNNAWFGTGEMSYQQLAMSRIRAVEHGRAVAVAATSGVSDTVAPDGSVHRSTDLFTADSFVAEMPLREDTTVATLLGPWPERLLLAGGIVPLLITVGTRVRDRSRWSLLDGDRNRG